MALDMFGGSAFAGPIMAFRSYLVISGFIWIIWLVVGTLTFAFIREIFYEKKALHENMKILIYPFIIAIASWIATGNAFIMALPVVAAVAIPPLLKKGINKSIQTGRAVRGFLKKRAEELKEEKRLEAEERTEETLEHEELSWSEQKFRLISELARQAGYGAANMRSILSGISGIIRKQRTVINREYKLERRELKKGIKKRKEDAAIRKAETYMGKEEWKEFNSIRPLLKSISPQRYGQILGLVNKEEVTERGELNLENMLMREENSELKLTRNVVRAIIKLRKLLNNQANIIKNIFRKKSMKVIASNINKVYRSCREEVPLWREVLREEAISEKIIAQEDVTLNRIYRGEVMEYREEGQKRQILGPLLKFVKR